MAISLQAPINLLPVSGIRIATAAAGIKYKDRDDLVLFELSEGSSTAVVLTKNQFCAAPVEITRKHLKVSTPKYLLINSGNANAGLGKQGIADAEQTCATLASEVNCVDSEVLPFSTGVIGELLPVEKITKSLPVLLKALNGDAWLSAAKAIMTTDTVTKGYSEKINLDENEILITGIAKGAGMIRPDMATMLAYVATDLNINNGSLCDLLEQAVDQSFHCITVDGDTSTNDSCVLVATGKSNLGFNDLSKQAKEKFVTALNSIFLKLAQSIIRDGEGITKYISVKVEQAKSKSIAREIAFTIAHSPLVKTAAFASDPNWGRILAAAGRATKEPMQIRNISLYINGLNVIDHGELADGYSEKSGQKEMQKDEIQFCLQLDEGGFGATVWTTDLSYDYVKINAEYRT
ncbi:MAG: bifunctional glutamate N-acetyltransferase/amino-acid acetyltransferase ArgJ [Gammaproteobacteria bacterium]|nr:MAG: bifunctional glutamate N-acetyltransferase/amino-acid acetyltransferase ArgJ [Gammaproteobacteria bacterium]